MTTANKLAMQKSLTAAAKAISRAKALVITAGAGMGVDSGLPDFRGPEGFWRAYPPLKKLRIQLPDMSNPRWFEDDPEFAWGFFGHRYNLYTSKMPHKGFDILREWCNCKENGYFVFTSNVDGHFQKANFSEDRIEECHGSIHFLQCVDTSISSEIWPVPSNFSVNVDEDTLKAKGSLPKGPPGSESCLARPNILMFGDYGFEDTRQNKQCQRFRKFQDIALKDDPFAVIEIGAGLAVPTVRYESESLVEQGRSRGKNGTLIRINPREGEVPDGHISLPLPGLEALESIKEILDSRSE